VDGSVLDHDSRPALLRDADIICAATSSHSPLFTSDDISSSSFTSSTQSSPYPTSSKDMQANTSSTHSNHSSHKHINLIGSYTPDMHEVDSALIHRAGIVVVDSRVACLGADGVGGEAGELVKAKIGGDGVIELGELFSGPVEGGDIMDDVDCKWWEVGVDEAQRARAILAGERAGLTVFKSVGVGVQDVAIAGLVVRRAEEMGGVGVLVAGYDA
jgi:ornithine cyclodeaminase/alanine dehydrogenase-like protein (mu-crystallin family)